MRHSHLALFNSNRDAPLVIRRYLQETCQRFTLLRWGQSSSNSSSSFGWLQLIWFLSCKIKLAGLLYKLACRRPSTCAGDVLAWEQRRNCDSNVNHDAMMRHFLQLIPQMRPASPAAMMMTCFASYVKWCMFSKCLISTLTGHLLEKCTTYIRVLITCTAESRRSRCYSTATPGNQVCLARSVLSDLHLLPWFSRTRRPQGARASVVHISRAQQHFSNFN